MNNRKMEQDVDRQFEVNWWFGAVLVWCCTGLSVVTKTKLQRQAAEMSFLHSVSGFSL